MAGVLLFWSAVRCSVIEMYSFVCAMYSRSNVVDFWYVPYFEALSLQFERTRCEFGAQNLHFIC